MVVRRIVCAAFVLLALVGIARPDDPPAEPAEAKPVYTRQGRFSIPFHVDAPANITPPAKVRLFVSEDSGVKWHLEAEILPNQQRFDFRSLHDGEYWFTIRSVDAQGRSYPDGAYEPQLRVIVDTLAPRLDLKAERGPSGEVTAHWDVVDTALDPASFKLEYQVGGGVWQTAAIDPASQHVAKLTLVGETLLWPAAVGRVTVRASVADRAGNPAVTQAQLEVSSAPPPSTQPASTAAAGAPGSAVGSLPTSRDGNSPASSGPPRKVIEWPAESTSDTLARSIPGNGSPAAAVGQDSGWRVTKGGNSRGPADAGGNGVTTQTVSSQRPVGETGGQFGAWPLGERPQMVSRRTFELDYEVEAAGSAGIAKVELWCTRDGGAHWQRFGRDDDNRSPILVTVDAEGLYGFRVVVESGNGLASETPRDGDLPEVWIHVDLTKPTARITATDVAQQQGELTIRWDASDAALEARPISLSFSANPAGPWTPIASGLENTGSYAWRLDNHVPQQIYVRLEARDEAGNVGSDETKTPVLVDRQRPQGRIRGVRPTTGALPTTGTTQR